MSRKTKISAARQVSYFVISILINALGNALTVTLNLGSALWTASAVNLSHLLPLSLAVIMAAEGVGLVILNAIILGKIEWQRIAGNLLFVFPFSFLIGRMVVLLGFLHITGLPLLVRIILDILGIVFIGIGISIYQRLNIILHPADDFMQILRFKFCRGHAAWAQLLSFTPPIMLLILTVSCGVPLAAINIGTLFALLFQGSVVGIADKVVFPHLPHLRLGMN